MLIFTLVTNVPQNKVTPKILTDATQLVSQLFDVSKQDVLVSIKAGVQMLWGIQKGSYGLGTVQNTDPIQAEDTKQFAPAIFDFCEKSLGIPQNRMYTGFITLNPENIAFDGKLYATTMDE
ncbi:hypothetical protein PGB90_004789 [Kerria lacca]